MRSFRAYLKDDVSGAPFGERFSGLFENIDISGLGEGDGFDSGWKLGHGRTGVEDQSPEQNVLEFIFVS